MRKKKGRFKLKNEKGVTFFSPEQIEAITLTRACLITTDAIMLALEHEIPIYMIERNGKPIGRFWSHQYGSIATIRRHQLEWSRTPAAARWMRVQLFEKLTNQAALLHRWAVALPARSRQLIHTARQLEAEAERLSNWAEMPIYDQDQQLRAFEGINSRRYFQAINHALPKRFRFKTRSRRPAVDAFNSLLNYLYGMLYQVVDHSLVLAGLDPNLGVLHTDNYGRPALTFDIIESLRPWADEVALKLCISRRFKQLHTRPKNDGLWLNEQGRRLAILTFDLHLDEHVDIASQASSRKQIARRKCKQLAQFLLKDWPRDSDGSRFLFFNPNTLT